MAAGTERELSTRVNRGIAWVGLASSLVGVLDSVALVVVLATGWISKAEYGIAGLATVWFPVLDLVTDLGLTAAVIQRDDHSREKISTVFWLNVAMSCALVLLLGGVVGPLLATFYQRAVIGWMLLAYGAKLLFQNVYFIPYALMKRELRFKELSILRVVANLAEFSAKVGFAWAGFGVWAFVLGPLCRVVVTGVGTQLLHPWRPALTVRWSEAREWIAFGFRSSGSKMLFYVYSNLDYTVVRLYLGEAAVGVYKAAYDLVLMPATVISEIITQVAFPVFARIRRERDRLVDQLLTFMRLNLVVMIAFLGVVFVATRPAFELLSKGAGEDWTAAIPAARVLCLVALLRALSFLVPPLLDGIGRPNLTLRYSAFASVVVPIGFVAGAELLGERLGVLSVAVAWAAVYPLAFTYLFALTFAALDLKPGAFIKRIIGIPLCGAAALLATEGVHALDVDLPELARFAIAVVVMLGVFAALLARFQGMTVRAVARALRGT